MTSSVEGPADLLFGAASTGDVQGPDRNHYPMARALHIGWRQEALGLWVADGRDTEQWEVVCAQCGDTDGPVERQTPPVQELRGPYPNRHKARHAASRHFKQWWTPKKWLPGSTYPNSM